MFILGVVFGPVGLGLLLGLGIGGLLSGSWILLLVGSILGLVFGTLGIVFGAVGRARANAILRAFEHGRAAIGRIEDAYLDTSIRVNGRSPWAIVYRFEAGDASVTGKARTWDGSARDRRPGQRLHVLFVESDPSQSTLYPPVK
jgi:hypothetical protein